MRSRVWAKRYWPRSGESGSARTVSTCLRTRPARTASAACAGSPDRACGRGEREVAAEHRHRLDHVALLGRQRVEPRAEQRDQAGRDVELAELAGQHQGAVALHQRAAIGQRPHRLDRVQRDALGVGDDPLLGGGREGGHRVEQVLHRLVAERLEVSDRARCDGRAGQPGRRSDSSGRANARMKMRCRADQSSRYSTKSSRPSSAQCMSSKAITTGSSLGQPLEEQPPAGEQLLASRARARRRRAGSPGAGR